MPQLIKISLGVVLIATAVLADRPPYLPKKFDGIGIDQRLNAKAPLDTVFRDESGASVPLRTYFREKPVLLVPVYFRCPLLCPQVLSGVVRGLRPLRLAPGRDFEIVAISFDPGDIPQDAAQKRDRYAHEYSSRNGTNGWHFLVGSQQSIQAVMNAVGFRYRSDPATKMFIHASGVMILTPDGRVSRYFYGVDFEPKDLKLGLVESSNGRIGSPVDQILLLCYHYDPKTGKYGAVVINILRLAGALMVVIMAGGLFLLLRRDRKVYRAPLKEAPRL